MDLQKEKVLVEKAKKDPEAFGALFDSYYGKILNYSFRRLGNIEIAKDITSQVFLKVLKNISTFQWKDISFSSWVYKIASNEMYDYFRKGKRSYALSLETLREFGFEPEDLQDIEKELIAAENELERQQVFLAVQKALLRLDTSYQEVLVLKYFEHKKSREIAEILGKKEGTVKSLISRGLAQLRNVMGLKNEEYATNQQKTRYKRKGRIEL